MKKLLLASAVATGLGLSGQAAADRIALVISTLNNPFFVTLQEGAEAKAEALGHELIVLDSGNDAARELSNVEDALSRDIDALLLNPTDADAAASGVRSANARNVPVITLDRSASAGRVASHIASDNVAGGRLAGEFVAERLGGEGRVVQLEGVPGASATRDRGEGFVAALDDAEGLELAASQPANFNRSEGLNVMENLLQAHAELDAVFAQNDEMALGAQRALQANGREDLVLVGFDGTDAGIQAVEDGQLDATVAQQPGRIGELGVATADALLAGESVAASIPVPLKLIVRD
ncbi:ribose ABC transporter substrate-binding protein RbsB [Halomonas koreensis]|uniref:Ribose ABC transporter substrate-binding protein RbsB n=1 Tax=Halomonas koreensis TaxID=245385 RepID=A0ABU1G348_9GAMM|nr:ribose ABC transporter substrate-binding protein RbsB [Halomonas koreensis]MDR5866988.1 ribose ABC transporter substrate-binding protein RbsB [Halomonas koreensis]